MFTWNGTTFVAAASSCPANPSLTQGDSLLRTNTADVQASPWNVPVCDPTATNPANTCRVVNENGTGLATPGDNLIAPRDFIEAILDFSAFGVANLCFDSLIFTSRSAHPLASADLKDVGGVDIDTCPLFPSPSPTPSPTPEPTPTPTPPTVFPPTGGAPSATTGPAWLALAVGALLVVTGGLLLAKRRRA